MSEWYLNHQRKLVLTVVSEQRDAQPRVLIEKLVIAKKETL
jgi:hypothetical protein